MRPLKHPKNRRDANGPGRNRTHRRRLPKTATEPALVRGLVVAVLTLLGGLGFTWAADVDDKTIGLVVAVIVAAIPLLQALWTRYAVTANAKVVTRISTSSGAVVAGDAAYLPTGTEVPVVEGENPTVVPVRLADDPQT